MEFTLPELGEGVYEAELTAWLVKPGDAVRRGQSLMEVMTDKATMEVPSPFAGTIDALGAEPGQQVKVGQVILNYEPVGQSVLPPKPENLSRGEQSLAVTCPPAGEPVTNGVSLSEPVGLPVKAAPSVRLMARKLGVNLAHVHGSGPEGRILVEDLKTNLQPKEPKAESRKPKADFGRPGTRVKLQGLRRKIAEHMVEAKRTIPHYGYVDECDVTDLVRLRESLKEPFARLGVKLTYLAFVVKAAAAALKEVPFVNASLDEAGQEIVLHDRYHIGIAVQTPAGLMVPVIHDADRKDLGQLAREIDRLSTAARDGKVKRDELRGGTFTVTSIGSIGGLFSTPVIHHPEVGILGLGKIVKRPVFDAAGAVKPADMIYLSFSFDHRVVDGAVGAAFGNAVIRHLQQPAAMLLSA